MQLSRINTLYQLYADKVAGRAQRGAVDQPAGILSGAVGWGAGSGVYERDALRRLVDLYRMEWCREVFDGLGIEMGLALPIVPPGTVVGRVGGELGRLGGVSGYGA